MNEIYKLVRERYDRGEILQKFAPMVPYNYSKENTLHHLFDRLYINGNEHLQEERRKYGYPDAYLVYESDLSVNAAAGTRPGEKLIILNAGIIATMHPLFEGQADIIRQHASKDIAAVILEIGEPVADIMVTYLGSFICQHESGHLVQQRDQEKADFKETHAPVASGEVPKRHALELDADWYATNQLAWQITGNLKDEQGKWLGAGSRDVEGFASLALSSVFVFFVKSAGLYPAMYYGDPGYMYPHPLIRINYVAQTLGKVIRANIPGDVAFDERKMLREALQLSEKILEHDFGNPVRDLAEQFEAHADEIEKYGNEILDKALSMPETARRYLERLATEQAGKVV